MAISTFIPQLWSARLLENLKNLHVATAFVNKDYEGEIKKAGDTVHINTIGAVTVKDYTKNTDIDAPEVLSTADQQLRVDQMKYYNFAVDDVDRVQAAGPLMDSAMREAAYGLADVADSYIFNALATGASTKIGTAAAAKAIATPTEAYEILVDLRTALNRAKCPARNRRIAVPPEFYGLLLKDDRFVKATAAANERLETGLVGEAAGFRVYETNNTPQKTGTGAYMSCVASVPVAGTYAEQVLETEAYRPEKRFADAVKGLHVYGTKVTRPAAVGVIYFTISE